jgi:hypothetical protein
MTKYVSKVQINSRDQTIRLVTFTANGSEAFEVLSGCNSCAIALANISETIAHHLGVQVSEIGKWTWMITHSKEIKYSTNIQEVSYMTQFLDWVGVHVCFKFETV